MGKLKVDRVELEKALSRISGGKGRSYLPILNCFLIETEGDVATVTLTNLSVAVTTSFPIEATGEMRTAIPYGRFQKLIASRKATKQPEIRIKDNESDIVLSQGKWRAKLNVQDANDYPTTPSKHSPEKITIKGDELYGALQSVIKSASKDDVRPILNGAHFLVENNKLTLQATDGFRLGKVSVAVDGDDLSFDKVIPRDTIMAAMPLIKTADNVEISITNTTILMSGENWRLSGQCVNGNYPDTSPIINQGTDKTIHIESAPLLVALSAALVYEPVSIVLEYTKDGTLSLKATNAEYGDMNEGVEVNAGEEDFSIGINPIFFRDVLKLEPTFQLKMADANSPIRFESNKDDSLWIIMPMHFGGGN